MQGLIILVGAFGLYWWMSTNSAGEQAARGAAFVTLVVGNLTLALADSASSYRVFSPQRRVYWIIVLAVVAVLTLIFAFPSLAAIFSVAPPDAPQLAAALAVGFICGGWTAVGGMFWRKRSAATL
jgi:Ca2+-transporting ATPase